MKKALLSNMTYKCFIIMKYTCTYITRNACWNKVRARSKAMGLKWGLRVSGSTKGASGSLGPYHTSDLTLSLPTPQGSVFSFQDGL